MPIVSFSNVIQTKDVELPTASKNAGTPVIVQIKKTLTGQEVQPLMEFDDSKDKQDLYEQTYNIMLTVIAGWNIYKTDGELEPINLENIKRLPIDDLMGLRKEIQYTEQLDNLKKNDLSSTLPNQETKA